MQRIYILTNVYLQSREASEVWGIEIVGFAICTDPNDPIARAANFMWTGSPAGRRWVEERGIDVGDFLYDLELAIG